MNVHWLHFPNFSIKIDAEIKKFILEVYICWKEYLFQKWTL